MTHIRLPLRLPLVQLVVADVLLIAAVFVPSITLISMPAGVPITQMASPALDLWNTLQSTPGAEQGGSLAVWWLIYVCAALEVVGLSALIIRSSVRSNRTSGFALAALPGAFINLLIGLFSAPALYYGLTFDTRYVDATLGLGILLAFLGAVLALVGLTKLAK